jgi:folate-binding protein YgfZ
VTTTPDRAVGSPEPGHPAVPDPVAAGYRALRSTAGVVLLPRDVVRASGPDTDSYLQGQCSQDVEALAVGDTAESLLLSPQGKVETYLRMTRVADDAFVLDTDAGSGPAMVARLERFRLRTKVTFDPLDWICAAVRGPDSRAGVTGSPELVLPVSFGGLSGLDLLGPLPAGGLAAWLADSVVRSPEAAWEAARIEAGVPVNGRELREGTIAAEAGLVERTVSFTKGCFTGQELVARLDARGSKVAHHLCAVVVTGSPGLPVDPATVGTLTGATVTTASGEHEVGHLSSVAWSPGLGAPVALALLHRRVEPPDAVTVVWSAPDGEVHPLAAEARDLPLDVG